MSCPAYSTSSSIQILLIHKHPVSFERSDLELISPKLILSYRSIKAIVTDILIIACCIIAWHPGSDNFYKRADIRIIVRAVIQAVESYECNFCRDSNVYR